MNPLVSIVMATYNDDPILLNRALESVCFQKYDKWEIVIVDDSTKVETRSLLGQYKRKLNDRMQLIHNDNRIGFVKSLNSALCLAKGKYIARFDGDDISTPARLIMQVTFLENHPRIDILGGAIEYLSEEGEGKGTRYYKETEREIARGAFFRDPLAHPAVMFRRDIIKEIGGYDEKFKKAEDYELWLRAIKKGIHIANLNDVVIKYQMSNNYSEKRNKTHWVYNLRAKLKNISYKYIGFSILGILLSVLLVLLPSRVIDLLYKRDMSSPIMSH